ncbi:radical SAM family heme chaperone HemW [Jannaschia sp. M317]|uniref:radical SAM family heme chaperone HemW n=1 Tax=Jannaschia sp. M317 TaxID=2867011 RepID=UPI0021A4BFB7|nr:radical SAM family heme chaperone HemW [Jannaschia sp. M317]UWQ18313.1 radical SAM family heme chaperone HemW [Jannaschia sp. M317]
MENWQRGGFGIYVHWPFCAAKCPYCDFNSHVVSHVDQARWLRAFEAELSYWADQTPGRVVSSVFFGGGTPSLMLPNVVAGILDAIRRHWTPANDLEVTLEANPTSVEAAKFAEFVGAGVTRFSVGLQALNDADLKALGRLHTVAEGRRAFEIARSVCDRVSFDLIYARQHQDEATWRRELTEAVSFGSEHLSLYQLTIEDGTAFGARAAAGRLAGLPDEDRGADMYEMTQDICEAAGLSRYEVSNHAAPGAACRHNLVYWRGGDWLGVGPGAHGRVGLSQGRAATVNRRAPGDWLTSVEGKGHGLATLENHQTIEIAEEYIFMSLRMTEGADLAVLADLGFQITPTRVQGLLSDDLATVENRHLVLSETGTMVLNRAVGALLPLEPLGK